MNFHGTQITNCIGTQCTVNYKFWEFQSHEAITWPQSIDPPQYADNAATPGWMRPHITQNPACFLDPSADQ